MDFDKVYSQLLDAEAFMVNGHLCSEHYVGSPEAIAEGDDLVLELCRFEPDGNRIIHAFCMEDFLVGKVDKERILIGKNTLYYIFI